jgi:hypothetical protein
MMGETLCEKDEDLRRRDRDSGWRFPGHGADEWRQRHQRTEDPTGLPTPQSEVLGPAVTEPSRSSSWSFGARTSSWDICLTDSLTTGNGWTVDGTNRSTRTQQLWAVAICLG